MLSYLLFTLGLVLIALPGCVCWTVLFPGDSVKQRWAWGSVLGIAGSVYLASLCALEHLSWFYAVWAAVLIVSIGGFVWRSRRQPSGSAKIFAGPNLALLMLLLVIAVLQSFVVMHHSIPSGWDPSFHLLLAKKIALNDGILRDWQPFEDAPLNYPLGSHFLMVLFARFSGLPLPRVFEFLMVTFSVLTTLAVSTLASEYFASEEAGLYAAIAYSCWAWLGSTDYLSWGGLPNQLGMLPGLAILGLVVRVGEHTKRAALIALLFASVCITHHHVMLTMGSILMVLMLFFLVTRDPDRRYRTIFFGLAMAAAAAAFFLLPYVMKAASLSQTNVFRVGDHWLDFSGLGFALVVFALAGATLDYSRKQAGSHVFHIVSATLILLYVISGPLYFFYQLRTKGAGSVAFTPSRFFTDLVYFLSLFAGYALYRFRQYFGWTMRTTIAIALLLGLVNLARWENTSKPDPDRGRFAAYEWIANHTPSDSIVMTTEPWASYATWRQTLLTPMPVSEPAVSDRIREIEEVDLLAGASPKRLRGIELLSVLGPKDADQGKVLWSAPDGWRVAEVFPDRAR